jgi:acyl-CoA reductase-like NAD-dependent aldehyde dehydrogenase
MPAATESNLWLHRNPADFRQVLAEIKLSRADETAAAVRRLAAVQVAWQANKALDRAARLLAWQANLAANQNTWVETLIREVGKPRRDAEGEVRYGLALLNQVCADQAIEEVFDRRRVRYRPHGLVGLITPWNNPFAIPIGKIAPALAYGNGVLWKPALPASGLSEVLLESLQAAGLGDLVALLPGDATTGRLLVNTPEIRAISFTGSVAVGHDVIRQCNSRNIPVQAELGGNNAAIVLADTDVEEVASQLAPAMFSFAGQRCTAIRRLIVEQPVYEPFSEALRHAVEALATGLPEDPATEVGPVISRERQLFLLLTVRDAVAAGGHILTGGNVPAHCPPAGAWLAPTVMTGMPPTSPVLVDELFGPVAALVAATDLADAIRIHNQVGYGLLGALFSPNPAAQEQFSEHAEAGILVINEPRPAFASAGPFIGWKDSGHGPPEHGRWNRDFYAKVQALYGG